MNPAFKIKAKFLSGLMLTLSLAAALAPAGQTPVPAAHALPDYLNRELKRLEETWNVLDQFAARIWPGWKNYVDVPFRFSYPNGVQMLVGHPSPTDEFELVPGVEIRGQKVYLSRRREIPLDMKPPIIGGGGVYRFGKTQAVSTVNLLLTPVRPGQPLKGERAVVSSLPKELVSSSDGQILLNIHEIFHGFQNGEFRSRFGNLAMNPDAVIALYSEIEGLALERAYQAADPDQMRQCLRDFLTARRLKRESMTEDERNAESETDISEGTAVFAEAMVIELMKEGFSPRLTTKDDPFYFGFGRFGAFFQEKLASLRRAQKDVFQVRERCYPYGCFQALLLSRLYPGWPEGFFKSGKFMDQLLREKLGFNDSLNAAEAAASLAERYPVKEIAARTGKSIRQRDAALEAALKQKGRVYMINFKATEEYVLPKARGESYSVGLIDLYPRGIEKVEIRDVLFKGAETLMLKEQLYHIQWIDGGDPLGDKDRFTLTYSRREGSDIYVDAVFTTPGFTLRAPKIQVRKSAARIKIMILEKTKPASAAAPDRSRT
jgi:hypothetical protein